MLSQMVRAAAAVAMAVTTAVNQISTRCLHVRCSIDQYGMLDPKYKFGGMAALSRIGPRRRLFLKEELTAEALSPLLAVTSLPLVVWQQLAGHLRVGFP